MAVNPVTKISSQQDRVTQNDEEANHISGILF
jgi:hypothetical protein